MPNGNGDGESLKEATKLLKPIADKIENTYHKFHAIPEKLKNFNDVKSKALFPFDGAGSKYVIFGILSLLALVFDFWVSNKTMLPLARITKLRPEFVAILFNLIDAFIAIYASGLLANGIIQTKIHKRNGGILLWSLFALKMTLFFVFTRVISSSSGSQSPIGTIVIVGIAVLVYTILHIMGGGLLYIFYNIYFSIKEKFIGNSNKVKIKNNKYWKKLERDSDECKIQFNDVLEYFGLNGKKL